MSKKDKLISVDHLKWNVGGIKCGTLSVDYLNWILDHEEPAVDAVPVKHGKWIDIDEQTYTWKVRCSCCGYERSMMSTQGEYPNYCEECGSRMDA